MTSDSSRPSHIIAERQDAVLRITFNRPDSLNAVTREMLDDAAATVEAAADDPEVRAIVITGAGRAFSSGADLSGRNEHSADDPTGGPDTSTLDAANRFTRALRAVPKPVLAAVNGPAAGVGCSFALAADVTIAKESAYFLLAFANVGLMPDGGATAFVPAAIGRARATRMAMLAERIPAPQAAEWGLITYAVPDDDFAAKVDELTGRFATGPTQSYARTKRAFNATSLAHLEEALAAEHEGQSALLASPDFAEGVTAFAEKRKPKFSGK